MMAVKAFGIRDRFRLELRGDAYNVFNHPQFTGGNATSIMNRNINYSSLLMPGSPAFMDPNLLFSSNPRMLQVALKVIW